MALYSELSLHAQTAYAELLDITKAAELDRSIADLKGGFVTKTVKGRSYWYYQYRDAGGNKVRQIYVGPDSERVRALKAHSEKGVRPNDSVAKLARAAIALGCAPVLPRHFRVIRQLADYGFFRAGGVLVGTHAFLAIGNLLGVHWGSGIRTQDLDFAHAGDHLSVGMKADLHVDVHKAIESLEMGFLPFKAMTGEIGGGYSVPGEEAFRLDFVTTCRREDKKVVDIPEIPVGFQPLKFMELSLESPDQAVIFCHEGAVVVNVPQPARFAVHKLIVYGERERAFRTKATKDIEQAGALLEYFLDHRVDELVAEWQETGARGRGWRKLLQAGLEALTTRMPSVVARLHEAL